MHRLSQRTFDGEAAGPHLLITGGVHGDEYEPIVAVRRLIGLFERGDPLVRGWRGRVTFVPVVNENAFHRGDRTAEDGLDLARVCPGRPEGSITERTAWALSQLIRSADYYIDLHTGGTKLSVLPLVGYVLHADPRVLDTQRRMARAFGLPVVWGTSPHLDGRSLSVARDAGIPALYAEYLGAATCTTAGVEAYVTGCLNVMSTLRMLDRDVPEPRIEHFVEDSRHGSGHLQVCNPSPMNGYFDPAVRLGDRVRKGDVLGTVFDPVGETEQRIVAQQDGIVLVLRTFPQVREGDSLCVVLETS